MKYKIKWRSKKTGATGEGKPIFNTTEMAEHTVNKLNEEAPFIRHWYVVDYETAQEKAS